MTSRGSTFVGRQTVLSLLISIIYIGLLSAQEVSLTDSGYTISPRRTIQPVTSLSIDTRESEPPLAAEYFLNQLVEQQLEKRLQRSVFLMLAGAGLVTLGNTVLQSTESSADDATVSIGRLLGMIYMSEGLILGVGSVHHLTRPSAAQNSLDHVLMVEDSLERHEAAADELHRLAVRAKSSRIWFTAESARMAVAYLGYSAAPSLFWATSALYFGLGYKTPEEIQFERFLDEE